MNKKILTAHHKTPIHLVPQRALYGASRVLQYANMTKYTPGNWIEGGDESPELYGGAILRHISDMQEINGLFTWASLTTLDVESRLPAIDHVISNLLILRTLIAYHGHLDADPGLGDITATTDSDPTPSTTPSTTPEI